MSESRRRLLWDARRAGKNSPAAIAEHRLNNVNVGRTDEPPEQSMGGKCRVVVPRKWP